MPETKRLLKVILIFGMIGILGVLLVVFWLGTWSTPRSFSLPIEITDNKGMRMRLIPAREFTMGSDYDNENRNSAHRACLEAFYMDKYQVANAHYEAWVVAGCVSLPIMQSQISAPIMMVIPTLPGIAWEKHPKWANMNVERVPMACMIWRGMSLNGRAVYRLSHN